MSRTKLERSQIEAALLQLDGWNLEKDAQAIRREFKFKNFSEAFSFMTRSALAAEKMDHHPEWSNVYNKVDVRLTTHSAGGVTALDIDLAKKMDRFVADVG
ncbi:4a-hydroxytetrahydrobiopterin dehydratase [Aquamicrobium zhengzhouense]|uniref:Putative pterin-4-alpha-carbinolamine dehydratase n=1 Tax=Aquamicrobium zhengzhouense TaxID=2781738 RepID=A0ABS0SC93_9HYPH|nr:4a-hydroxytetrahydrobiopterin dehydratase [Aquamicrobium zhengzhouense]MBI1620866.1 4a-hydroxytetrahydrobiopterin dehydratase [Aquamicrobium zhengzhouense]